MDFEVKAKRMGDASVLLEIKGSIDSYSFQRLQVDLEGLLQDRVYDITLDLSRVDRMCSAGAGVLIHISSRCEAEGGRLALAAVSPPVRRILDALGIYDMFASNETAVVSAEAACPVRN